jgi:hypothetical protein
LVLQSLLLLALEELGEPLKALLALMVVALQLLLGLRLPLLVVGAEGVRLLEQPAKMVGPAGEETGKTRRSPPVPQHLVKATPEELGLALDKAAVVVGLVLLG